MLKCIDTLAFIWLYSQIRNFYLIGQLVKKYIYDSESLAEFLGAFTLLFVGAGFVVVTGGANIVGVALAHGLAIAPMVAAFGYISGAVFNPALTIALWSIGKIDGLKAIKYIVSQLSGAIR